MFIDKIQTVKAIGRLYDFSSRMKFHLIEKEFLEDEIGKLALEINDNIATESGINIFTAKNDKDLYLYERVLNRYNMNFTKKNFDFIDVGDDVEFLDNIAQISIDKFNSFQLMEIVESYRFYKSNYDISVSALKFNFRNPDYIDVYYGHGEKPVPRVLFQTLKINHKHKEKILFTILSVGNLEEATGKSGTMRALRADWQKLSVIASFVLPIEKFYDFQDKPSQLFLQIIHLYGVRIGEKNKKIIINDDYYKGEFNSVHSANQFINKARDSSNIDHNFCTCILGIPKILSKRIDIAFSIDMTKFFLDYKRGLI